MLAQPKKLYLCGGSNGGILPPTYRNTKRYARLVVGNVRVFKSRKKSVMVHAICVGCCYTFLTQGISHNLQSKKWYISATLLLYQFSFGVLKRKIKVAPVTDLGIRK